MNKVESILIEHYEAACRGRAFYRNRLKDALTARDLERYTKLWNEQNVLYFELNEILQEAGYDTAVLERDALKDGDY